MDKGQRAFGLDILRASAILLVIFAHMTVPFKNGLYGEFWKGVSSQFGTLGVEIFFVLSGFLIGTIIIKIFNKEEKYNLKQIKNFWTRRWYRTLPNYYLVLFLTMFLFYWLYNEIDFSWRYLLFLQTPQWLIIVWSLIVEEWFYLLFPLLLFGVSIIPKIKSKYKILLITICITIVVPVLSRILNILTFIPLFDKIGIGVLIGFLCYYHNEFYTRHRKIMFLVGLLLFFISVAGLFEFDGLLLLFDKLVLNFSILFMIPMLSQTKQPKNRIIFNSITYISIISYSLYLTHTTIIEVFYKIFGDLGYIGTLVSLVLVFSIASILYYFYEKPTTDLRDRVNHNIYKL